MNRRQLLGLGACAAAVPFCAADVRGIEIRSRLAAKVIPAPDRSLVLGPAVLDKDGNRIGQLVFQQEGTS